jgi:DHA1 family multidrug resistance protein-like MFS transporter
MQSLTYFRSAASAIAANTFLRSLAGAGFPLFSQYMFAALGVNWAGTLLGCVAAVLVPIPVIFYIYGHKIRERSAFAPTKPFGTQEPVADETSATSSDPAQAEKIPTRRAAGENAV